MIVPDRSDKKAFAEYVASVMQGWAEGRGLESCRIGIDRWQAVPDEPFWNWHIQDYRLAPEAPAVEPFTLDTLPKLPIEVAWKGQEKTTRTFISSASDKYVWIGGASKGMSYEEALRELVMLDGSPFGTVKAGDWPKYAVDPTLDLLFRFNEDGTYDAIDTRREDKWDVMGRAVFSEWITKDSDRMEITQAEAEAIEKARAGK